MPSLVKKWQSIQKELDEEEKSSSSDEDRDQLNKKSIEEWKHQQLMTYVTVFHWHISVIRMAFLQLYKLLYLLLISHCFYLFFVQGKSFKECQL